MAHFTSLLNGLGIGALGMYFLDPLRGRYRRALVRDRCVRWMNETEHALGVGWRDLEHRTSGWLAECRSAQSQLPTSDATLESRVRSKLGRSVSHPKAVEVSAQQGRIRLSGHILADEVSCLVDCVQNVPGVLEVENNLQVHNEAGDLPALQGPGRRRGVALTPAPSTQLLLGVAACAATTYFFARRAPFSMMLGAAAWVAMAAESKAVQQQRAADGQPRQNPQPAQQTGQSDGDAGDWHAPASNHVESQWKTAPSEV